DGERLTEVRPWHGDPEPLPLIENVASAQHHPTRIDRPYVRQGWRHGLIRYDEDRLGHPNAYRSTGR
ncbi:hypothetical protein, partial [Nocardia wallacei]|uniref:hypothetical protein n=1 Tax=Nocardia wallacei TaxID=480035 RepID=UPI00245624ED